MITDQAVVRRDPRCYSIPEVFRREVDQATVDVGSGDGCDHVTGQSVEQRHLLDANVIADCFGDDRCEFFVIRRVVQNVLDYDNTCI